MTTQVNTERAKKDGVLLETSLLMVDPRAEKTPNAGTEAVTATRITNA